MLHTSSIQLLDSHTINKIAAGEVVERPASVVKELVENSIDAGASSVTVEIKTGGIDFIRITDNGIGIKKEEAEIAFLRHATSKIQSITDLEQVATLGFRGEALASIAAVAYVELITKRVGDMTGLRLTLENGKVQSKEEIACPEGTTFIIRHLFHNVPARKAFLKGAGTEGAKIADYMYKLALAHPEVSFKYIQNQKNIFQTSGNGDLSTCLFSLYGKEVSKNMISVHSLKDCLRISGLISKPTLSKGNRNFEYFFINGRSIKNHVLQRAVEEAYKGRITIGKFPFVVLHLYVDPQTIDVNVHPNKLEVRLQNSDLIYDTVLTTLTTHLKETNLIPMPSFEKTSEKKKSEQPPSQLIVDTLLSPYQTTSSFSPEKLVPIPPKENLITPIKSSLFEAIPEEVTTILEAAEAPELYGKTDSLMPSQTPTLAPVKEGLDYTIIGQIFATYWLVDYRNKLLMIDQHAAHERLNYEKFMADFRQNQIATQLLLVPDTHMVTAFEKEWLIAYQDKLSHLGFLFQFFGEESIIVREVPYLFHAPLPLETFYYLLESLKTQKVSHLYDLTEEHIIQLACKYSVKANDKLSKAECQALIEALLNLENPFTCPHGRPTIIAFTKYEIEKLFKRV